MERILNAIEAIRALGPEVLIPIAMLLLVVAMLLNIIAMAISRR
jgi:hypothetical protein